MNSTSSNAWKVSTKSNRRIWYDRSLRLWTMQTVDEQDNQIGEVDYTNLKLSAFKWLKYGK